VTVGLDAYPSPRSAGSCLGACAQNGTSAWPMPMCLRVQGLPVARRAASAVDRLACALPKSGC
jgi:hypothetical protein